MFQIRNFPETNQNVVCYDTMISVDNSDGKLRPGMTANVAIVTAEQDNAIKIPNTALRYRPPDAADASAAPVGGAGPANAAAGGRPGGGAGGPGGAGGGARGGAPGAGGRGRGGHPPKTIYVLADGPNGKDKIAKPVQIRTGIGDGVNTEVTDGLKEGDEVIIGQSNLSTAAAAPAGPSNPFGGGNRRF